MSVYKRKDAWDGTWHYRKVVRLPDGSKVRIAGTPTINTKHAAEEAEIDHVERTLKTARLNSKPNGVFLHICAGGSTLLSINTTTLRSEVFEVECDGRTVGVWLHRLDPDIEFSRAAAVGGCTCRSSSVPCPLHAEAVF